MALNGAVLKNGTTLSATGGTDYTYTPTGKVVAGGIELIDGTISDRRVNRTVTLSCRMATYDPVAKSFSKDKRDITIRHPKVLADGTISQRIIRISIEEHPEATDSERSILENDAAQVLFAAAFSAFRKTGSLA